MKNSGKKRRKSRKRERSSNRLNGLTIVIIMLVFTVVIAVQIKDLKSADRVKDVEIAAKQEEYENESERTSELEEQRVYVQTKKYVEEEAKKLGFVYPDEIILKPLPKD